MSRFSNVESMFCRVSNRDIILGKRSRFSACWARFQDKVGRTLGRMHQPCHDLEKHDKFFTAEDWYISVSVQFLKESWKREKLGLQRR